MLIFIFVPGANIHINAFTHYNFLFGSRIISSVVTSIYLLLVFSFYKIIYEFKGVS